MIQRKREEMVRVGVIGCGEIAQSIHLPYLLRSKRVQLRALCDSEREVARRTAEHFGVRNFYDDSSQMLEQEELDMVDICTPTYTHKSLAIEAAKVACHVLVEKPIASSVEEADDMIDAARECGVLLGVVHDRLFTPTISKMINIVKRRELGRVVSVQVNWLQNRGQFVTANEHHWVHQLPGGKIIGEDLIHPIYIVRELLGNVEPVAVYPAKLSKVEHLVYDEVRVMLKGERGEANIFISYDFPRDGMTVDVLGTRGNLHGEIPNSILVRYEVPTGTVSSCALANLNRSIQILSSTIQIGTAKLLGKYQSGHQAIIHEFIHSILNNSQPPVTGIDGREAVRLLAKVIKMTEKGS